MSDFFKISCPKCTQHIECPNELIGQFLDCPNCGDRILALQHAASDPAHNMALPPLIPQEVPLAKPPLWNIPALVIFYRERRKLHQASIREDRANYIASIMDLIRRGEWSLSPQNVVLLRNEKVLWNEPAILYEWKVVGRHYESVSFSTRRKKVVEKAESPVAHGIFLITDHRLIFSSAEQSFSVNPEKLLNIHLYPDGIRFAQDGRKQPRALKFARKNGDVIQAILNLSFASSP
jgi:hypothetical protein